MGDHIQSRDVSPGMATSPVNRDSKKSNQIKQKNGNGRKATTGGSSPMQTSSIKAKAGLHNQAFDTSTEEKNALFNDMKIMAQMGQQMSPSQQNRSDEGSSIKIDDRDHNRLPGQQVDAEAYRAQRGRSVPTQEPVVTSVDTAIANARSKDLSSTENIENT